MKFSENNNKQSLLAIGTDGDRCVEEEEVYVQHEGAAAQGKVQGRVLQKIEEARHVWRTVALSERQEHGALLGPSVEKLLKEHHTTSNLIRVEPVEVPVGVMSEAIK